MCLAIPVQVAEVDASGLSGAVDYLGTRVQADFTLLGGARTGDWVLVHAGFAISRLDEKEAEETLDLFREIRKAEGA